MKNLLFILFCILPLTMFSTEPTVVAKYFIENFAKGNIAEAKKYVDQKSLIIFSFMENQSSDIPKYPNYEFNIVDSIIGNNATIIDYIRPDKTKDRLILVKENNEWKVSLGHTKDF